MDKEIIDFITATASILNINDYSLILDNSNSLKENTLAQAEINKDTKESKIIISKKLEKAIHPNNHIQVCLVIAHELRHLWQDLFHYDEYNSEKYYNGEDKKEYERQLCEVDANAFAFLMVDRYFGKSPSVKSINQYSYDLILERVYEIQDDFEFKFKAYSNN